MLSGRFADPKALAGAGQDGAQPGVVARWKPHRVCRSERLRLRAAACRTARRHTRSTAVALIVVSSGAIRACHSGLRTGGRKLGQNQRWLGQRKPGRRRDPTVELGSPTGENVRFHASVDVLMICLLLLLAMGGIGAAQRPDDPQARTKWPVFFNGPSQGATTLCIEIAALKPPPQTEPNPGVYSLRYRVTASDKVLTRVEVVGMKPWEGSASFVAGNLGGITPGEHEFRVSASSPVDSLRVELIMQNDLKTGEVVADVRSCKAEQKGKV